MRALIVNEWMTLDGVVQAPGQPDEDRSGGFQHGGWHMPYFHDLSRNWVVEGYAEAGGFLFGRRTYELLASYWPHASEEEQVIAEPLNTLPKYVASTTLTEPLEWEHATLLTGDVAEAVAALKGEDGKALHVIGSAQLVHTLIEHDLVDQLRLMVYPVVAGAGKRLFEEISDTKQLRLVRTRTVGDNLASLTYDLVGAACWPRWS